VRIIIATILMPTRIEIKSVLIDDNKQLKSNESLR
jgi:hypothetical protein